VARYDPSHSKWTGRYQRHPARCTWVLFVIQRCSWTHRSTTRYSVAELNALGYRKVPGRFDVNTEFDRILLADLDYNSAQCQLDCCDVRGIA
jgi:hypothetical protein